MVVWLGVEYSVLFFPLSLFSFCFCCCFYMKPILSYTWKVCPFVAMFSFCPGGCLSALLQPGEGCGGTGQDRQSLGMGSHPSDLTSHGSCKLLVL